MDVVVCDVQTWHKMCFKCTECNMTLNMKNYKGYNKMPYCNAYVSHVQSLAVVNIRMTVRNDVNSDIAGFWGHIYCVCVVL